MSLATLACLAYFGSELFVFSRLAFPLDDSWIHLQFARQLAEGHGLTYNGDGWVPGSTAPLWTALLGLGFLLPVNVLVWAKFLGWLAFLGTVAGSDRLAVRIGLGGSLRLLSTACVVACHWLVWSALSGMEISLFACVSLWAMVWHLDERDAARAPLSRAPLGRAPLSRAPLSHLLFAVACLLRPEGLLLWVLAWLDGMLHWKRLESASGDEGSGLALDLHVTRQRLISGFALALVLLLPILLFNVLVSGSPLPTTFAVKGGGGGWMPDGAHLRKVLGILFGAQPVMTLLAGAGCLSLVRRLGGARDVGLLPALWLLGLPLANAVLSPSALGNFGRYYFPLLPLVAVLGAVGLQPIWRFLGSHLRIGTLHFPWRAALILLLLAPQAWSLAQGVPRYLQTLANVEDSDVKAAHWLAERLPPEATLAVQDIGALKFWLPNRVVDLAGIVTPEVQSILASGRGQGEDYWERRLYRFLETRRPDYFVVFPGSYPMLTSATSGFTAVQRFPVEQNVTMAGPELVIYRTPWTRHALRNVEAP